MISYKSEREISRMCEAGKVIVEVFDLAEKVVRPGVSTLEIDTQVEALIRSRGGIPSFKGYHGFPASICTSVNDEVVHGIPSDRVLGEGDLFSIDVGVIIKGYHGDAARSFAVGQVTPEVRNLMETTLGALDAGIEAAQVGNRLSDIARAVEACGREAGYGIVEEYVGHGIGSHLHEDPQVPNYVSPSLLRTDLVLRPGLVLALEPMFNLGTKETRTLGDGWTVVTADNACSAHFEDTVVISRDGPRVLTRAWRDKQSGEPAGLQGRGGKART